MSQSPLRIAIIGGSGLGQALGAQAGQAVYPDTPFGKPSAPITLTQWQGVEIALLPRHGVGHVYPPTFVPYRANIFALKSLGVTHVIASGAAGSLREAIRPGDLVVADQVIDRTFRRPGTFYERAAVHVEFSHPFCPVMRRWLLAAAPAVAPAQVHDGGCYVCMEGPAFSTLAESRLHRSEAFGGDLIGMTAMPEAKLAREAELPYALLALPTDYDCWKPHPASEKPQELLSEIIANLDRAVTAGMALIQAALQDVALLREQHSPAQDALRLAIWSDKSRIDPAEIDRLRPLWGAYFHK